MRKFLDFSIGSFGAENKCPRVGDVVACRLAETERDGDQPWGSVFLLRLFANNQSRSRKLSRERPWSRRLFLAVLACGDRAPLTGTNSHASASASFGWGGRFYALKRSSDSSEAAGALVGIRAPPYT